LFSLETRTRSLFCKQNIDVSKWAKPFSKGIQ